MATMQSEMDLCHLLQTMKLDGGWIGRREVNVFLVLCPFDDYNDVGIGESQQKIPRRMQP